MNRARKSLSIMDSAGRVGVAGTVAPFIEEQAKGPREDFQLPDPISGYGVQTVHLVVVGLNPGYDPQECDIPRFGSSFDDYYTFYRDRFATHRDNQARVIKWRKQDDQSLRMLVISHYTKVDRLLRAIHPSLALGGSSVYLDAWPWRSSSGTAVVSNAAITNLSRDRVNRLLAALQPAAVLALGQWVSSLLDLTWTPGGLPRGHGSHPVIVQSYHPAARTWNNQYAATLQQLLYTHLRARLKK